MAAADFLFALELSDDADSGRMLGELCTAVLGHVGYSGPAVAELTGALAAAVLRNGATGAHRYDVRFVVGDGELQIVVACAGAAEWRASRPLPAS